jgi:hypothetical protein
MQPPAYEQERVDELEVIVRGFDTFAVAAAGAKNTAESFSLVNLISGVELVLAGLGGIPKVQVAAISVPEIVTVSAGTPSIEIEVL